MEPAKRIKKQILAKRHRMNEEAAVDELAKAVATNDQIIQ